MHAGRVSRDTLARRIRAQLLRRHRPRPRKGARALHRLPGVLRRSVRGRLNPDGETMDAQSDPLAEAWRRFAERIGALEAVVIQNGTPDSPRDRAEGYRYLARALSASLDLWIKRGDPEQPQ